jgi:hypothetical protein
MLEEEERKQYQWHIPPAYVSIKVQWNLNNMSINKIPKNGDYKDVYDMLNSFKYVTTLNL